MVLSGGKSSRGPCTPHISVQQQGSVRALSNMTWVLSGTESIQTLTTFRRTRQLSVGQTRDRISDVSLIAWLPTSDAAISTLGDLRFTSCSPGGLYIGRGTMASPCVSVCSAGGSR